MHAYHGRINQTALQIVLKYEPIIYKNSAPSVRCSSEMQIQFLQKGTVPQIAPISHHSHFLTRRWPWEELVADLDHLKTLELPEATMGKMSMVICRTAKLTNSW